MRFNCKTFEYLKKERAPSIEFICQIKAKDSLKNINKCKIKTP